MRWLAMRTDWVLVGTALVLSAIGVAMIRSCTSGDATGAGRWLMQMAWIAIGIALLAITSAIDYTKLSALAAWIYGACLFLLVLVLLVGTSVRGAQRWLPLGPFHLQPTELVKIAAVLTVAAYLAAHSDDELTGREALISFAMLTPAMLLAVLQPDMGTPVVLVGIWVAIAFAAGVRVSYIAGVLAALVAAFAVAWCTGLIRPHQKARLLAFANPEADKLGGGWQVHQSLIAVGSGHLFGQGYMRGTQTQLGFIPDQEADFIFTAIAEELGFVGSVATLALLGLLLFRGLSIATATPDRFGQLVAVGIVGMLTVHVMVSVGMTLGLMPVKGMPLPFVSYGGSHMLACMIAVGLLNSIWVHRKRIDFDM